VVDFARDTQHFAARTHISDWISTASLNDLADASLSMPGKEDFGVLIDRLLDVAADLGGLRDRTRNGGLDRTRSLFPDRREDRRRRSLAVPAVFLTNSALASGTSRFWKLLSASVTGAKASLTVFRTELVSVVIWSLHPRFELWAHPVRIGPGQSCYAMVNGASQQ